MYNVYSTTSANTAVFSKDFKSNLSMTGLRNILVCWYFMDLNKNLNANKTKQKAIYAGSLVFFFQNHYLFKDFFQLFQGQDLLLKTHYC